MRRILLLNYEFPPIGSGGGTVSFEIAKRLSEKNIAIDVVTMGYKNLPAVEIVNDNLTIYRVKSIRIKKEICSAFEQLTYLFSAFLKGRKLVKNNEYDICHAHFIIPTAAIAFIFKFMYKLDYVITAHGSDVPGFNPDRFKFLHKFTPPFLKIISKFSKKIITPSNFLKNLILEKISKNLQSTIIKIPNGINLDLYKPQKKEKTILSTGRLLRRKGFQHIIKAVSEIDTDYIVHIVGDGPMDNELKELAKDSKIKVVFHGWIDNTSQKFKDLLEQSDIFIQASNAENASMALLEAMSAGCAVISTKAPGNQEILGENGFYYNYGDVDKLKTIIKQLEKEDLTVIQEKNRQEVINTYDWSKIANLYERELFNV